MKRLNVALLAIVFFLLYSTGVAAESQYKIVHKDQVTEGWEIHVDYPLFEQLENKAIQERVNNDIIDKLEEKFRMVKRGAGESIGIPYLYYEETIVYEEKEFFSVVMTSHISRGDRYNSTVSSVNFVDGAAGEIRPLKEVVHMDRLNKAVEKIIQSDPDTYFQKTFRGVRDNTAYYLQKDKIVLVFNKYEVAPGVFGTPEMSIPLKGMKKEHPKEKRAPVPSYTSAYIK
ncbi:DUF3298 domain-containing protein [Halobacillus sp. ACCC02827]|uniref:DUF3298 and DUF4163 domain-containing protein n=1 Tax=Halobacillus sp. ACCC02827 TaxID=3052090 RepID=UPI0025702963|nr:DUF3298 and DUF4163 domain-containing protein [Halobacillus sp. ACCC02827]WJE16645.1 DUF3298 domain-containing protein [Halobacillus sp. ACCC02827]